jgi:hypothetical protein
VDCLPILDAFIVARPAIVVQPSTGQGWNDRLDPCGSTVCPSALSVGQRRPPSPELAAAPARQASPVFLKSTGSEGTWQGKVGASNVDAPRAPIQRRELVMAKSDPVFLYIGTYPSEAAARSDTMTW